jgi:serine-type D-Ala-D-Ala carboxypeptidase
MLSRAREILGEATSRRRIPGAVLHVEVGERVVHASAHGVTQYETGEPTSVRTWFDLASLTKILATTPAVMLLWQGGRLDLDAPLVTYLPEVDTALGREPVWRFLHHTSGARDWEAYYERVPPELRGTPEGFALIRSLLAAEEPIYQAGASEKYSDVNFALLAWMVERISGQSLTQFVREKIFASLTVRTLGFLQTEEFSPPEIAATEICPWRGKLLVGGVHDDNTYAAGAPLGQAGLFGDAAGVAQMMAEYRRAMAGNGRLFLPKTVAEFMHKPEAPPGGSFRLGFDSPSGRGSSTGRHFGHRTFGHLGFTGVSAWCDPDAELTVVLLTNRVHPRRGNEFIKELRPALHDAIWEELAHARA